MLKLGICGFEFSHHVVVIVVTIVAEYPGISELGKQVATNLLGVPRLESAEPCATEEERTSRVAFRLVEPLGRQALGCKQPLPFFPMREAGTRTIRQGYAVTTTVSGSTAQTAAYWFSIFWRINQHSRRKARRNAPVHHYCELQNRAFEALVQMAANLAW